MSRSILLLVAAISLAACAESTSTPTKTPTSTTSVTSGTAPTSSDSLQADPGEKRADDGDDLR